MADRKEMYLESMEAIRSLVDQSNQDTQVPACPGWTVKDVIAHQLGVFVDVAGGNTEGGGTPEWTDAQVQRYKTRSFAELWQEWDEAISDAGDTGDNVMREVLPDLIVHEFDIRGAIGNTENRDNPYLVEAANNFMAFQDQALRDAGVPAVRLIADGVESTSGAGAPQIDLRTSAYEATRFLFGRRSEAQVLALDWSGDPGPWLETLPLMPLRATDLVE